MSIENKYYSFTRILATSLILVTSNLYAAILTVGVGKTYPTMTTATEKQ
jgi:hypothetical protein